MLWYIKFRSKLFANLNASGNPVQWIGRNRPNMSPLLFGFVGFTWLGKAEYNDNMQPDNVFKLV